MDRLEPFFAYLGADLAWPAAKLCLVAEIDLEGALEHYDPPLMPFQRAEIVEVIRGVFSENGFEIPRMGCALPAPAPKAGAPTEPQHSQTTGQSQQTPVQEPSFEQVVALSDAIDQSLRGTAKLMNFSELALCRQRYFEAAGDHPAEEHTPLCGAAVCPPLFDSIGQGPLHRLRGLGPLRCEAGALSQNRGRSLCKQ